MLVLLRLNLGCGTDIREGWVNLDCKLLPGVDVVHDISYLPLPFADEVFEEILCQDILEHVADLESLLKEIYRVLQQGGKLSIRVPHFTSKCAYNDPTHRRLFGIETLLFFVNNHRRSYYFDFSFSKKENLRIVFDKIPIYFYNYFIEVIVNINFNFQKFYEGSLLRIFPAQNIEITLIK